MKSTSRRVAKPVWFFIVGVFLLFPLILMGISAISPVAQEKRLADLQAKSDRVATPSSAVPKSDSTRATTTVTAPVSATTTLTAPVSARTK